MTISSKPWYGQRIGTVVDGEVYFSDDFMRFLDELVDQTGSIPWANLSLSGSDLAQIETRRHEDLQEIRQADDTSADDTPDRHISDAQAKTWTDADIAAAEHIAATSAHGATGDLIGTGDAATTALRGAVYQGLAVDDAESSTVAVAAADVTAPPGTWDTAWGDEVRALANELKADLGSVVSDHNDLTASVNALLSSLRTAGIIEP